MLGDEKLVFSEANLKSFLRECLGPESSKEVDWLSNCFSKGMQYYLEIESQRRSLRLPFILAEPSFVLELRRGSALRSLRRMFLLCRVQRIVEDSLDAIIAGKFTKLYVS